MKLTIIAAAGIATASGYGGGAALGGGAVLLGVLVWLVIVFGFYVWVALALSAVFAKAGESRWKAWVPIVNSWTLYELGGQGGWWVLLSFLPVLDVIAFVFLIIAIHNVNLRFGRGAGSTVLAVFLFPIWASVLGWGSARPVTGAGYAAAGAYAAAAAPAPTPAGPFSLAGAPAAAAPAARPVLPPPAPTPAPAAAEPAFGTVPPPTSAFGAVPPPPAPAPAFGAAPPPPAPAFGSVPPPPAPAPAFGAAPPPPAPPAPAFTPPPAPTPEPVAAADHWAPPVAPTPATPAPATPAPVTAVPVAAGLDEEDEHTVITPRRQRWTLRLPGGDQVTLTSGIVYLGRNPASTDRSADAQLVTVADGTKTVSKTHAVLRQGDEGWTIEDLGSTNGVVLLTTDGAEIDLVGIQPVTERFLLGDAELRISIQA